MEVRTPREFFEKVLPARFSPEKVKDVEAIVQMDIKGPNGGKWTITIKDQKMAVKDGVHPSPTMGIRMADSDFVDVVNGKLSGIEALMAGKLEFDGSIGAGMKLLNTGLI
ncbi:SCP2 sterol-binding domain-containing protein [Candidatus Bathyarchaeota archaeon]|nr:SCP2 sterol-binding domain-containing protein [Candidatus Bathyarchaeota archaeon]